MSQPTSSGHAMPSDGHDPMHEHQGSLRFGDQEVIRLAPHSCSISIRISLKHIRREDFRTR